MDAEQLSGPEAQAGSARLTKAAVALCFKVPLRFRRWFKLQALSRNVTMTEFLIEATQWYSQANIESLAAPKPNNTRIRK
jgi:hypothetical protein